MDYGPRGRKEPDKTEQLTLSHTHTHTYVYLYVCVYTQTGGDLQGTLDSKA